MRNIRFGIIGFGFMGHVHEDMITNQIEGAEVTAICDNVPGQMEDSVTPGVKKFTDADQLFAQEDVDVVLIVVPNHLHCEMVKKAAEAGKDIICEKPAAMNAKELDEMVKAVDEAGVKFTVHQQRRFDKDFRTMKRVYDSGELGKIYTIQSKLFGINGNMHDWHIYKEFGGGMMFDWGVHLIDQILYMVDSNIKTVFADVRNVINREVDDYFKILLEFENGVMAEIELGTYFLADKEKWFEHHWFLGGNQGSAYSDGFDPTGKVAHTTRLLTSVPGKTTMSKSGPTRSFGTPQPGVLKTEELPVADVCHRMYFDNYVKAYRGEEEFLVKIPEVRRVLALIEAARLSSDTGEAIHFH